jgi:hypothetical protein
LALVQDTYDSPDDLKQILEPFIFDRLSHHIQVAIDEGMKIKYKKKESGKQKICKDKQTASN